MTYLAFGLGPMELWLILGALVLIFGARKLPELARAMGSSITQFKKGLKEETDLLEEGSDPPEEKGFVIDPSSRATKAPVLGVVFCGGRSVRMGFDKAQARWGQTTLLERAVATLQSVAPEVVLACGSEPRYPELGLDCVLDRLPDGGPLAGLEAGLEHGLGKLGAGWVFALACDLPHADGRVFEHLQRHAQEKQADACLLEIERGSQPLYAAYASACLPAVRSALDAGERRMIAWHAGHGAGPVVSLDLQELPPEIERSCAKNVNTPEDLRHKREVHE